LTISDTAVLEDG